MKILAALLLAAVPVAAQSSPRVPWTVGEPLPHVHLPDLRDGTEVDLASFRGRRLLLIEFASW